MLQNYKLLRHNLNHEICYNEIKEILELNKQYYNNVSIRCAVIRDEKEPSHFLNALCIIKVLPHDIVYKKCHDEIYNDIFLLEEWLTVDEFLKFIDLFKTGIINIKNYEIYIDKVYLNQFRFLHEPNWSESFPGYLYTTIRGRSNIFLAHDPLLDQKYPFYPNYATAIASWCEVPNLRDYLDVNIGTISIFLPELRAYFESLKYDPDKKILNIKISQRSRNLLFLKGAYNSHHGYQQIDSKVEKNKLTIPIIEEVADHLDEFELYLIEEKNNILDYHKENRFSSFERIKVIRIPIIIPEANIITKAIMTGENEMIEFKPYIEKGENKINEIIETVIAFANTRGGSIFLGINKYAIPEGIENDIKRKIKGPHNKYDIVLQEYIGYLRKEISDKINSLPEYKIEYYSEDEHDFVIIEVKEGEDKPYANIQTKEIYIRRGSNNVKPDPRLELPKLIKMKKNPFQL